MIVIGYMTNPLWVVSSILSHSTELNVHEVPIIIKEYLVFDTAM